MQAVVGIGGEGRMYVDRRHKIKQKVDGTVRTGWTSRDERKPLWPPWGTIGSRSKNTTRSPLHAHCRLGERRRVRDRRGLPQTYKNSLFESAGNCSAIDIMSSSSQNSRGTVGNCDEVQPRRDRFHKETKMTKPPTEPTYIEFSMTGVLSRC
jgi:hypothetical protein